MEKILIIDDFDAVRKTIKRVVERENFIALQACDGKEGLEVFEREKPDVVITDLKMPNIDGKGVLCAVKEQSPETEVIVLTGYGDPETERFLLKKGAFRYLQKPLDLHQLVKILGEVREKIHKERPTQNTATSSIENFQITISKDEKIIVSGDESFKSERGLLAQFVNQLQIPVLVIDQGLNILFSNLVLNLNFENVETVLTSSFIENIFHKGLINSIDEKFIINIRRILDGYSPDISPQFESLYKSIAFLKVRLSNRGQETPILILMFQGKFYGNI